MRNGDSHEWLAVGLGWVRAVIAVYFDDDDDDEELEGRVIRDEQPPAKAKPVTCRQHSSATSLASYIRVVVGVFSSSSLLCTWLGWVHLFHSPL